MDGGWLRALDVSASGMRAERARMDVIAQNIANAESTHTKEGGPYRRRLVVFEAAPLSDPFARALGDFLRGRGVDAAPVGVRVRGVVRDPRPFREVYDPGHPDADARGIVRMPNVNAVEEMVDLVSATRSYEADATAMDAAKRMFMRTLDLLR